MTTSSITKLALGESVELHCDNTIPGIRYPATYGASTLDYGKTYFAGGMSCDSEPAGVTCTDGSTGHFFRVSRESYEVG